MIMDVNEYYERRGDARMLGDGSLLCGRCFSELAELSATLTLSYNKTKDRERSTAIECSRCFKQWLQVNGNLDSDWIDLTYPSPLRLLIGTFRLDYNVGKTFCDEDSLATKPNDTEILDKWNSILNMIKRSM